jgi:hypothetical protein
MKTLIFSIVALGSLNLEADVVDTCYSQCLGINTYSHELRFLGNLSSIGKSRLNSWRQLNQKCAYKAKRLGLDPILSEGTFVYESDKSWSTYSWSQTVRYSRFYSVTQGESSMYQNDILKIRVDWANPQESCSKEEIDWDDFKEYYEGELPVQG